jgi:hypothetical protein
MTMSYFGHPDPKKMWITTVWEMKPGDTYTTAVGQKVCIYKVEETGRGCFPAGWWVSLKQIGEIPLATKWSE